VDALPTLRRLARSDDDAGVRQVARRTVALIQPP
jgi:hypothetical protein